MLRAGWHMRKESSSKDGILREASAPQYDTATRAQLHLLTLTLHLNTADTDAVHQQSTGRR